jgi:ribosomal protein L37AE/L43A
MTDADRNEMFARVAAYAPDLVRLVLGEADSPAPQYFCPRCHNDHIRRINDLTWCCLDCRNIDNWKEFIPYPETPPPEVQRG